MKAGLSDGNVARLNLRISLRWLGYFPTNQSHSYLQPYPTNLQSTFPVQILCADVLSTMKLLLTQYHSRTHDNYQILLTRAEISSVLYW